MKYPNKKISTPNLTIKRSTSKRGMSLEDDINNSNRHYRIIDKANIYKKPTPVTIVKVEYPSRNKAKITEAYYVEPSTTDYNGIYKGRYIDFEAKECSNKTLFPLKLIHEHQLKHLKNVYKHGAIAFMIIRMNYYNHTYLIFAKDLFEYIENNIRKSLTIEWIEEKGYKIKEGLQCPLDYLSILDLEIGGK